MFDNSIVSKDLGAKSNARAETSLIVLKIILAYLFTFFATEDYHWMLTVALLILSYYTYRSFLINRPYLDNRMNKFFLCLCAIFVWGNINLFIVMVL